MNNIKIEPSNNVSLYKSTDYKKFKLLEYNRDCDEKHIQNLKEELSKCNDLHLKPLIVSPDLEIIDGQHRFRAAKELGIPVYYVIDYEFSPEKLISHNTLQKSWSMQDSFKFYLNQGNDNYFLLKGLMDKYPFISLDGIVTLLTTRRAVFRKDFKEGKYKYVLTKELLHILECMKTFKKIIESKGFNKPSIYKSASFISACLTFFRCNFVSADRFFERLEKKPFSFTIFASTHDFILWFVDVYNYDVRNKPRIRCYKSGSKTTLSLE